MQIKIIFISSLLFVQSFALAASREPVRSKLGMVVSTNAIASQVGAEILKKGGNAVDASVAVGLALAVTWPSGGNVGGGGFMLLRTPDGKAEVIDYRERAPLAAHRDMYLDDKGQIIKDASTVGYKAVAVPGTIAGFALAHKRHGSLPWKVVVEPARKLAADGFVVDIHFERALKAVAPMLAKFDDSAKVFLRGKENKPYREGERIRQPELAVTLARIQKNARDFYEGQTAKLIVADLEKNGGLVTLKDLKEYEPTLRKPLEGKYRGFTVLTMPPPSSGGAVLLQELNILETYKLSEWGFQSTNALHVMIEAMKHGFADRAKWFGDTDFVKVPLAGMIDPQYAKMKAQKISLENATPAREIAAGEPAGATESPETTHYTVADKKGMVVSNTYTLNGSFGSGVVARKTGVLLNNEMDDFTSKPGEPNMYGLIQDEKNAIVPKKRPLSSMTPTIVLKDNKFYFSAGSPGGPTIINTVLQVVTNIIDFNMTCQEAVDAPRIHHQWMPDELAFEPMGLNSESQDALERRGHLLTKRPRKIGDAQVVLFDESQNLFLGAADPRLGGLAVGL